MTTNWTLARTSPPTSLPVSLKEAKEHLRLSLSDDTHDEMLILLITAATERLEHDIDRQIINATYRQTQFAWGGLSISNEVKLKKKQILSIASVTYAGADGSPVVMDPSEYIFDAGRGSLFPAGGSWPEIGSTPNPEAIEIVFDAGYGDKGACVPAIFKQAILLTVGKWFFDPAQEGSALHSQEVAYGHLTRLLHRATYP